MEVAVAIGTDPATTFAAIVPAPPDVEEYLISGFLRQKPLELVKAETVDLEVPANAEYILEGYVQLGELRTDPAVQALDRSHGVHRALRGCEHLRVRLATDPVTH